jgi:hypothetical protein
MQAVRSMTKFDVRLQTGISKRGGEDIGSEVEEG